MPLNYIACVYALIAVLAAHILCKMVFKQQKQVINKATAGWVLFTVFVFVIPSAPLYFFGAGIILLLLAPKPLEDRLAFYFAMLPIIPTYAKWQVSVPGIQTIMILNHVTLLALFLLIPIYYQHSANRKSIHTPTVSSVQSKKLFGLFVSFLVIAMLLDVRGVYGTSILRHIIQTYLETIILVLVIFKICTNREVVDKILFSMMISGVFLAFVSIIEVMTTWPIYGAIDRELLVGHKLTNYYRNGFLRAPTSMAVIPFGLYMSAGIVAITYFSGLKKRGNTQYSGSLLITLLLFVGMIFSGSRGAQMAAIIMMAFIFLMHRKMKPLRGIVAVGGLITLSLAPAIISYLADNDPHGTFQYRVDLFHNSMITIKDNLFLGAHDFIHHPAMQASMQGEGIIDIVNKYLDFALSYGVPMLILILFVIFSVVRKMLILRRHAEISKDAKLIEWQTRIILALIIGYFSAIITVSFVDRMAQYTWICLALGLSILRYGYRDKGMESFQKSPKEA